MLGGRGRTVHRYQGQSCRVKECLKLFSGKGYNLLALGEHVGPFGRKETEGWNSNTGLF